MKKIVLLIILITAVKIASAQTPVSVKTANKWVKSKVWAKDLKVKADPSINSVEFKKQYEGNKELWDKVFKFLGDPKLATLAPGKYVIDGDNAYAIVTDGAPKNIDDVKWESHRKYIDLQYVISGGEKIGVSPVADVKVTEPYNQEKDVAHYSGEGKSYDARPGTFFLFFPGTAHRPNITPDGNKVEKKIVIKVRAAN